MISAPQWLAAVDPPADDDSNPGRGPEPQPQAPRLLRVSQERPALTVGAQERFVREAQM
jgi:hypothetical protein